MKAKYTDEVWQHGLSTGGRVLEGKSRLVGQFVWTTDAETFINSVLAKTGRVRESLEILPIPVTPRVANLDYEVWQYKLDRKTGEVTDDKRVLARFEFEADANLFFAAMVRELRGFTDRQLSVVKAEEVR